MKNTRGFTKVMTRSDRKAAKRAANGKKKKFLNFKDALAGKTSSGQATKKMLNPKKQSPRRIPRQRPAQRPAARPVSKPVAPLPKTQTIIKVQAPKLVQQKRASTPDAFQMRGSFPTQPEVNLMEFLEIAHTPSVTPRPGSPQVILSAVVRSSNTLAIPALVTPSPSPVPVVPIKIKVERKSRKSLRASKSPGPSKEIQASVLHRTDSPTIVKPAPKGRVSPKDVPTVTAEKPSWLKEGQRIKTVAEFKSGRAIGTEGEIRCWNDKLVRIFLGGHPEGCSDGHGFTLQDCPG